MPSYPYTLIDVFTDKPFSGNQLAVFTDAQGLSGETMQTIAREMNLAETTFVLPAKDAASDFHVRIFSPAVEMPTAGHPTVGTALVLAEQGKINRAGSPVITRFEEQVGVIPVELTFRDGSRTVATMDQPIPTFGDAHEDRAAVAALLSVDATDLDDRYPIQQVSSGVPFLFIPARDRVAIGRMKLRLDLWERDFRDAAKGFFLFTLDAELPGSLVHCRMFAPALGIPEDPATGIAHGPLGAYLLKHGVISGDSAAFISEQGFEMRRPSLITVTIEQSAGKVTRARVSGSGAVVAEGTMYVD
jgi:trans-2,3-dihydro-3-hydroxyanthranilate isomerase